MATKNNPLISVIIPSYNSAEFIEQTIHSVLIQTYNNFEIIVIDDSSQDNTLQIVEGLSLNDDRIKFYKIEHSGRPSVPRNFGIQKAKGEFIAFLDSDDLWVKDKLEYQMKYFQKFPEITFVYSMSKTFGNVNIFSPSYEVLPLPFRAAHNYNSLLKIGNTIPLSTVLIKTEILRKADGFDEDIKLNIVEDYDLWLRLSKEHKFIYIPRIHTYYRIHQKQISRNWEINKEQLKYLAQKRNLVLPEYNYFRNKNIFLRMVRNIIHFASYVWVKFYSMLVK